MANSLEGFLGTAQAVPKRIMPVFFLVDTSKSMEGQKIGAVNAAIEEILPDLRHMSESQADSEIRLAVLRFSTGCEWVTPGGLISLDSFGDWDALEAEGLTDLGSAFAELNAQLSETGFIYRVSGSSGFYAPVIILLSDGEPTDDWYGELKKLQQNKWYQSAIRIAIAVGDDADEEKLKKAIRNPELMFKVTNISSLKKVIKFIMVTSSTIASSPAASNSQNTYNPADVQPVIAEQKIADVIQQQMQTEFPKSNNTNPFPVPPAPTFPTQPAPSFPMPSSPAFPDSSMGMGASGGIVLLDDDE